MDILDAINVITGLKKGLGVTILLVYAKRNLAIDVVENIDIVGVRSIYLMMMMIMMMTWVVFLIDIILYENI